MFWLFFWKISILSENSRYNHKDQQRHVDITEIPSCVREFMIFSHDILVLNFHWNPQNEYISKRKPSDYPRKKTESEKKNNLNVNDSEKILNKLCYDWVKTYDTHRDTHTLTQPEYFSTKNKRNKKFKTTNCEQQQHQQAEKKLKQTKKL